MPCYRKLNSLPNSKAVCDLLKENKENFIESVNNANNLYFVDENVNRFKLTFFQKAGASESSKNKRTGEIQSATMKYFKDIRPLAKDVAAGFVKVLNQDGSAGISVKTKDQWTKELLKIIDGAITEWVRVKP